MDDLEMFADWWLRTKPIAPPPDLFMRTTYNVGITLFRHKEYQVQLFLSEPDVGIDNHLHPGVDSIEVYVGGDLYLRSDDVMMLTPEMIEGGEAAGMCFRVRPDNWHGATTGPRGGAFLSIQKWANGKPTSIHLDWKGPPMGAYHAKELGNGGAEDRAGGLPCEDKGSSKGGGG